MAQRRSMVPCMGQSAPSSSPTRRP
jgi:hypothetical protein